MTRNSQKTPHPLVRILGNLQVDQGIELAYDEYVFKTPISGLTNFVGKKYGTSYSTKNIKSEQKYLVLRVK